MEQHPAAAGADMYGLEQGGSRYFVWRCNWCALGGMDRFVRPHATTSLIDYAQNKLPGQLISLDTGDSNVRSVFRNSRYTANFVCIVSFYRATVYLQDNSVPLFLKALEYAARVFRTSAATQCAKLCLICFRLIWTLGLLPTFETQKESS